MQKLFRLGDKWVYLGKENKETDTLIFITTDTYNTLYNLGTEGVKTSDNSAISASTIADLKATITEGNVMNHAGEIVTELSYKDLGADELVSTIGTNQVMKSDKSLVTIPSNSVMKSDYSVVTEESLVTSDNETVYNNAYTLGKTAGESELKATITEGKIMDSNGNVLTVADCKIIKYTAASPEVYEILDSSGNRLGLISATNYSESLDLISQGNWDEQ